MSAFNAKNLSYTKQEPTFLRKLREQHGSDRSNVQIARPTKDRIKTSDGDEDEPTIFDEHGETLGKDEWEQRLKKDQDHREEGEEGGKSDEKDGVATDDRSGAGGDKDRRQVAEAGVTKKRKVGKVVGAENEEQDEGRSEKQNDKIRKPSTAGTKKKKPKKVKLSFDEPD
jgi:hypothetical protein